MATTKEHMERALMWLRLENLYLAENELANALHHYLVEKETKNGTSSIEESI